MRDSFGDFCEALDLPQGDNAMDFRWTIRELYGSAAVDFEVGDDAIEPVFVHRVDIDQLDDFAEDSFN